MFYGWSPCCPVFYIWRTCLKKLIRWFIFTYSNCIGNSMNVVIFDINTTSDISKLLYVISRAVRRVKFETIWNITNGIYAKYHVQIKLILLGCLCGQVIHSVFGRLWGKTRASGTKKRCSHKWFHRIFPCTNTFCTSSPPLRPSPPPPPHPKPRRRCEPEENYLRCSKRFDRKSHFICSSLSQLMMLAWETQRNARVAY